MARSVLKVGLIAGGLFFSAAAAVHVPAVRALVAGVSPRAAACPMGGTGQPLTAAQRDEAYEAQARALAGVGQAQDLNFLELRVGESTRASVGEWATARGLTCRPSRGGYADECTSDVPQAISKQYAAAQSLTVFFAYSGKQKLVETRVLARYADADEAVAAGRASLARAEQQAGSSSSVDGEFTADFLRQGLLRQARATFRRENLYAVVSSTNFGAHYEVIQQMQALTLVN